MPRLLFLLALATGCDYALRIDHVDDPASMVADAAKDATEICVEVKHNTPELREKGAAELLAAAGRVNQMSGFVGLDGFVDEILHVVDKRESAETYNRGSYGEVMKILSNVVEGTPQVESYEVANSTFHNIVVAV